MSKAPWPGEHTIPSLSFSICVSPSSPCCSLPFRFEVSSVKRHRFLFVIRSYLHYLRLLVVLDRSIHWTTALGFHWFDTAPPTAVRTTFLTSLWTFPLVSSSLLRPLPPPIADSLLEINSFFVLVSDETPSSATPSFDLSLSAL